MTRRNFLKLTAALASCEILQKFLHVKAQPQTAVDGLAFDGAYAHFDGGWYFGESSNNSVSAKQKHVVFMPFVSK